MIQAMSSGWSAQMNNDFGQYASRPGRTAHYYAELAVSSSAVAETRARGPVLCTYSRRDGQAEWACMNGLAKHRRDGTPAKGGHRKTPISRGRRNLIDVTTVVGLIVPPKPIYCIVELTATCSVKLRLSRTLLSNPNLKLIGFLLLSLTAQLTCSASASAAA